VKKISKCILCCEKLAGTDRKVTDHFCTGKKFDLLICPGCELIYTSPLPSKDKIGEFYRFSGYVSHSEKPGNFFQRIYFFIRKIMIKKKIRFIKPHLGDSKRILDYGSGTGVFLARCIKNNFNAFGYEPDDRAGNIAREKIGSDVMLSLQDIDNQQLEKFDMVTLWHVLEHIYDLDPAMKRFNRILRDKGMLVLALPNYESFDASYYKELWGGYDVPRHLYHFNFNAIKVLAKKYGYVLLKARPLVFDSYFVSLLSEKYKKNPIFIARAMLIGLISNLYGLMGFKPYSSMVYFLKKQETITPEMEASEE